MSYTASVITVSDLGSRGLRQDTSGPAVRAMLEDAGFTVVHTAIVPDEREQISALLRACADERKIDLILNGERHLGRLYRDGAMCTVRREWRGIKDTVYDFYEWARLWGMLLMSFSKDLIPAMNQTLYYRWMVSYFCCHSFMDKNILGLRGSNLRMSHELTYCIYRYVAENLVILAKGDRRNGNSEELNSKLVLIDEMTMAQIMAGFPTLIYLPAQVLPVFLCSILDQQITPPYLDAAENFGIPADVCPLPSAEAGCALRDEYPKLGTCFVACNMPCDGSVATTSYQDRYFNLPTYYFGVPIRYNEEAVQDYAVEELRGLIRFIEEQTGETFDWDAFFRAMKVYNQETEYELQKWEVNRTPYPQMTGETFWIYRMFFYHLSGGMDPHFLDTDRRVNRIMMRGYQQKKPCAPAMRHRCVEWSCPANFYPDFSVWAENCWGINVVVEMESLNFTKHLNTSDETEALRDMARLYERMVMRRHTNGGHDHVLGELWRQCENFNANVVIMYQHVCCKTMAGLQGLFDDQARELGIHLIWVEHDLMDPRTVSRKDMRGRVNNYMVNVMHAEPVDPTLIDIDDEVTW